MKLFKNVVILGDSYSTFTGYIPEDHGTYYAPEGPWYITGEGEERMDCDVLRVEQTWWYNLMKEHANLLLNSSWSGTTICNTGYNGCDNSECSFVARFEKLVNEGFFEKNRVDTFILFGGTNDSWANSPLGEPIESGWTEEDLYNALPAFLYLIHLMKTNLTDTKIYFILNSELKEELSEFYKYICKKNDIPVIELHDIEKRNGHPTIKGMEQIKNQVYDFIRADAKADIK